MHFLRSFVVERIFVTKINFFYLFTLKVLNCMAFLIWTQGIIKEVSPTRIISMRRCSLNNSFRCEDLKKVLKHKKYVYYFLIIVTKIHLYGVVTVFMGYSIKHLDKLHIDFAKNYSKQFKNLYRR